jgi:hypothetical protein
MRYPCNLFGKPAGGWPLSSDPLRVERWRCKRKRPFGFDDAEQTESARTRPSPRSRVAWLPKQELGDGLAPVGRL